MSLLVVFPKERYSTLLDPYILSNLSKVFERIMYDQISIYFDDILSKYQCGFRKGFGTQQCLVAMTEKWRKYLDKGGSCGALLTDLSKAFDCLVPELLVAKLHAYGFDSESLTFIYSYLSNRKQRVKIKEEHSDWLNIVHGVPQGSILGPLCFNIYTIDMFFIVSEIDIASFADDNTPYIGCTDTVSVINKLETVSTNIFKWYEQNAMKVNAEKCHVLLTDAKSHTAKIGSVVIKTTNTEKLLGVTIDGKLSFQEHINGMCTKASQKLNALSRLSSYMSLEKRRVIMKAFVTSHFAYCPLVWMLHNRTLNNKINRIHERALRVVYQNKTLTFDELLLKDNSIRVHHKNLQILATEIFKVRNELSLKIMEEIFEMRTLDYNLRNDTIFRNKNFKTVRYGQESLSYLG